MTYLKREAVQQTATPQMEQMRSDQVKNSEGAYVWEVSKWTRLQRWLILGSEGGSFYAQEQKLTKENTLALDECLVEDGPRVVELLRDISVSGRAIKQDPVIFALAKAAASPDPGTKNLALRNLPVICRTGTHLFMFCGFVSQFRGWGRSLRRALADWYTQRSPDALAYQLVKYRQRGGWSHRDVLRLAHPGKSVSAGNPAAQVSDATAHLFSYVTHGMTPEFVEGVDLDRVPHLLYPVGFERAARATDALEVAHLVAAYKLTREMVPSQYLNDTVVQSALLADMPMTATVRNLGAFTASGLLKPWCADTAVVVGRLANEEQIKKSRIHPIQILAALKTYEQGHGERGKLTWTPVREILDALDSAFYLSFQNVEPTGHRICVAVDVSSSMTWGNVAGGVPGLTAAHAAAAMAMLFVRTEPKVVTMAFAHEFRPLNIGPRDRLDGVMLYAYGQGFGGTDCALPMLWAEENKYDFDTFIVLTDSETHSGRVAHPAQALVRYRRAMDLPGARLAVFGMTSNGFSIADPRDPLMMDFVGFDTNSPTALAAFMRGEV